MIPEADSIFSILCDLLEPFNVKKTPLHMKTEITVDLNMDSVSVMDFIMSVEDRFECDIPLNVLSDLKTIGDLVHFISKKAL